MDAQAKEELRDKISGFSQSFYSWKRIGDALNQLNIGLEEELPNELSEIANWLCTAEQIIKDPISLRLDDAKQTLATINDAISQHKVFFDFMPILFWVKSIERLDGKLQGREDDFKNT